jgi:3-phenylpropionate/cinnamic acid dioxygenase small subunit
VKTKRARPASRPTVALTPRQALWLELTAFYIREAWLLDERKLEEWLQLFTDDVLYFMPRRKNVPRRELHRELTPQGDLAILEEDRRHLEMRVERAQPLLLQSHTNQRVISLRPPPAPDH